MEYNDAQLRAWDEAIDQCDRIPVLVKKLSRETLRAGTWLHESLVAMGTDDEVASEICEAWCRQHFMSRKPLSELLDLAAQRLAGTLGT